MTNMRQPRINLKNDEILDLWRDYQFINSTILSNYTSISRTTATKAIKYAQAWREGEALMSKSEKQRYIILPTDIFFKCYGIDVTKAINVANLKGANLKGEKHEKATY